MKCMLALSAIGSLAAASPANALIFTGTSDTWNRTAELNFPVDSIAAGSINSFEVRLSRPATRIGAGAGYYYLLIIYDGMGGLFSDEWTDATSIGSGTGLGFKSVFTAASGCACSYINDDGFLDGIDEFVNYGGWGTFGSVFVEFATDGPVDYTILLNESVPEPANWAMLIAGFGLVGGALRMRRAIGAETVLNLDGWKPTFDVKPSVKLSLPLEKPVKVW
jgi:PEP-CTERM motif